ncbi:hypothetical protein [Chamaesiphon sp.]|uniref:hypothetical protein n=1 Tax=Chamaesiphon sp. TaxID=2814140 RepID=UPI003593FD34
MNEPKYIYRLEQVENGGSKIIGDFSTLHQAMNTGRTPLSWGTWSESTYALVYNLNPNKLPADRAYDRLRAMSYHIERYITETAPLNPLITIKKLCAKT